MLTVRKGAESRRKNDTAANGKGLTLKSTSAAAAAGAPQAAEAWEPSSSRPPLDSRQEGATGGLGGGSFFGKKSGFSRKTKKKRKKGTLGGGFGVLRPMQQRETSPVTAAATSSSATESSTNHSNILPKKRQANSRSVSPKDEPHLQHPKEAVGTLRTSWGDLKDSSSSSFIFNLNRELGDHSDNELSSIRRCRSLEEPNSRGSASGNTMFNDEHDSVSDENVASNNACAALHSSFDAAALFDSNDSGVARRTKKLETIDLDLSRKGRGNMRRQRLDSDDQEDSVDEASTFPSPPSSPKPLEVGTYDASPKRKRAQDLEVDENAADTSTRLGVGEPEAATSLTLPRHSPSWDEYDAESVRGIATSVMGAVDAATPSASTPSGRKLQRTGQRDSGATPSKGGTLFGPDLASVPPGTVRKTRRRGEPVLPLFGTTTTPQRHPYPQEGATKSDRHHKPPQVSFARGSSSLRGEGWYCSARTSTQSTRKQQQKMPLHQRKTVRSPGHGFLRSGQPPAHTPFPTKPPSSSFTSSHFMSPPEITTNSTHGAGASTRTSTLWGGTTVPVLTPTRPPVNRPTDTGWGAPGSLGGPSGTVSKKNDFSSERQPLPSFGEDGETKKSGDDGAEQSDVTAKDDSISSSSPPSTPFRFSSFPASLPRVNNPRVYSSAVVASTPRSTTSTVVLGYQTPFRGSSSCQAETVRKRMLFGEVSSSPAAEANKASDCSPARTTASDDKFLGRPPTVGKPSQRPPSQVPSSNREDDGTHNSSISSISVEGPSRHLTPGREASLVGRSIPSGWSSPGDVKMRDDDVDDSHDSGAGGNDSGDLVGDASSGDQGQQTIAFESAKTPCFHARLFSDDEQDECGYSEQSASSPVPNGFGGVIGRTRLNFNSPLSPSRDSGGVKTCVANNQDVELLSTNVEEVQDEKPSRTHDGREILKQPEAHTSGDLTQPYDQNRTFSFPSASTSTQTPLRNHSGMGVIVDDTATAAFTPFRFGAADGSSSTAQRFNCSARTPREVQIQFHLDSTQCSPIPGDPDEEIPSAGVIRRRANSSSSSEDSGMLLETNRIPSEVENSEKVSSAWQADSIPQPSLNPATSCNTEAMRAGSLTPRYSCNNEHLIKSAPNENEGSGLSVSNVSSMSSSTVSKGRKVRPMPDMSAFDVGSSATSSSSHPNEMSADGTSYTNRSLVSGSVPSRAQRSPKLLCPPTPVRTPAWASFGRSDSLIATKVLAACPAQILDGLSSLENSLLEDENSGTDDAEHQRRCLKTSFSAVEEMEDESDSLVGKGEMTFKPLHREGTTKELYGSSSDGNDTLEHFGKASKGFRTACGVKEVGSVISFNADFENLGLLGKGAFADVYKARSKYDGHLYAIKRNRRQFRGKRDRDRAMKEVQIMQRLQSACASSDSNSTNSSDKTKSSYCLYLLFFITAWQEEGYFFCQTELCCRDTCRQMMLSLTSQWNIAKMKYPSLVRNLPSSTVTQTDDYSTVGRLVPESTVWKICHDVSAGLSHIHSHGVVHHDIKPSNIFFVSHSRLGAMCKIGDFGMAGETGTIEDGQEGDTVYMPRELLSSGVKHPSADIFSLGLTIYELASAVTWELPTEGVRWHGLRSGSHVPEIPKSRSQELVKLIREMISPDRDKRPSADAILESVSLVKEAGIAPDLFLRDYIEDVHEQDLKRERQLAVAHEEANRRRFTPTTSVVNRHESDRTWNVRTPTPD